MLFNESSVRFYHDLSKKEILGIEATGSVVRKTNNFEKIFLYAITIQHPSGKPFPLPGALYITGNHTIESVRYFIMCLREKERSFFSKKVQSRMNIADNSRVLQTAVLLEYNGETIDQYCDRMYTLITEKQEEMETEKTFMQLCSNHLLAQMKRTLIRLKISEKHFVMRILGRLIECKNLSGLKSLVIAFYSVTMAEYAFEYVTKSLTHLNNAVNEFQEFDETIDNITNEIENEKLDEEYLREGEQNSHKGPNRWNQYWNERLTEVNTESISKCLRNNFYMPNLFKYVRKLLLNEVVI